MKANEILEFLNKILSQKNCELIYEKTYPSSKEDFYEIEFWILNKNGTKDQYSKLFIREAENFLDKAFQTILNNMIETYYNNYFKNE